MVIIDIRGQSLLNKWGGYIQLNYFLSKSSQENQDFIIKTNKGIIIYLKQLVIRLINQKTLKRYYEKQGKIDFNQQLYQNPNPYRKEFHQARKHIIISLIKKLQESGDLLDTGCGDGEYTSAIKDIHFYDNLRDVDMASFNCYGIDISSSFIERAKQKDPNGDYEVASLEKIPFKDNQFDIVLCSETLEHVLDYPKALSEVCRVSKKYIIISVPIEKTHPLVRLGLKLLGKKDMIPSEVHEDAQEFDNIKGGHLREFSSRQLDKDITSRGFKIIKRKKIHNSALITVFFVLSEKLPFLNKLSSIFIPIIKIADCLFPWWGLTYIVIGEKL